MKNRRKIKGEQNLQYNQTIWKKNDAFDILNDIREDVTLVQLMDSLGNVNNAISVAGYWVFYSNYKKALYMTKELLDIICSSYIDEEIVETFISVFYSVRYIWAPDKLKE